MIKIVGIGGSLENNSITFAAMKFALDHLQSLGAEVISYDLSKMNLPIYNPAKGIEQAGGELIKYLTDVRSANAYIFASPEYHGTVSGLFKNAIDYFEFLAADKPPYLSGKPVGAIATAGGGDSGAITVHNMVNIIHSLRGIAASGNVVISSAQDHFTESELKSEIVIRRLNRLANEVFELAEKLK